MSASDETPPGDAEVDAGEPYWGWGAMSPSFYEGVGHVVTMASSLEFFMVRLALGFAGDDAEDWQEVQAKPGEPLKALGRAQSKLPAGPRNTRLLAFIKEARAALEERNRVVHSLHNVCTRRYPEDAQWFSVHPRKNAWTSRPPVAELDELAVRLRRLAQQAIVLYPHPRSMPLRLPGEAN